MKNLLLICVIGVLLIPASFAQGRKAFIKSFLAESPTIVVDMEGKIQVIEWEEDFVRIASAIEINNFNERILMRLIRIGRYAIITETINNITKIKMPKLATQVSIKGEVLKEVVTYEIYVPKGTNVQVLGAHNYISF